MSRYYRIIKGIRYDKALLESVHELTAGQGDGRISVADAQQLWSSAEDGGQVTKVERRTIYYILDNYRTTAPAKAYLYKQLYLHADSEELTKMARQMAYRAFGIHGISYQGLLPQCIQEQEQLSGQQVGYSAALRTMFETLLNPSEQIESPYNVVLEVYELYSDAMPNAHEEIQKKLMIHLSNGVLHLLPIYDVKDYDTQYDFYPPEEREDVRDHWVFYLTLPTLSDHLWWIIVPRNGDRAYAYGFN